MPFDLIEDTMTLWEWYQIKEFYPHLYETMMVDNVFNYPWSESDVVIWFIENGYNIILHRDAIRCKISMIGSDFAPVFELVEKYLIKQAEKIKNP